MARAGHTSRTHSARVQTKQTKVLRIQIGGVIDGLLPSAPCLKIVRDPFSLVDPKYYENHSPDNLVTEGGMTTLHPSGQTPEGVVLQTDP